MTENGSASHSSSLVIVSRRVLIAGIVGVSVFSFGLGYFLGFGGNSAAGQEQPDDHRHHPQRKDRHGNGRIPLGGLSHGSVHGELVAPGAGARGSDSNKVDPRNGLRRRWQLRSGHYTCYWLWELRLPRRAGLTGRVDHHRAGDRTRTQAVQREVHLR